MKRFFTICLLLVLVSTTEAQNNNADEAVTRRIANYILEHSEFAFSDIANKQTYQSTKDIPDDVEVKFKSPFGEWHYTMGVLNMAMVNLSNFLNEDKYFDFAAKHIAF